MERWVLQLNGGSEVDVSKDSEIEIVVELSVFFLVFQKVRYLHCIENVKAAYHTSMRVADVAKFHSLWTEV